MHSISTSLLIWLHVRRCYAMITGKVKWFNDAKGYGFIELEQGRDVFVHYSVIEADGYKSLREGQEVLFELQQGPKGDHATRVLADAPASA